MKINFELKNRCLMGSLNEIIFYDSLLEDCTGSHDVLTVIEGHCGSGEMFFILKQYFAIVEEMLMADQLTA